MERIDPHDRKRHFEEWKTKDIEGISKTNSKHLKDFILDLEAGLNVGGNKGTRSPARLLANSSQVKRVMKIAEKKFNLKDITKIKEEQLHQIFLDIQQGKITKDNGKPYTFAGDVIKRFKTFWHWYIKVNRKKGIIIPDITQDLKSESSKSAKFVYFTKEQVEEMIKVADYETKAFILFAFDTGIRSPTESFNARVSDFSPDFKHFHIRDEVSKTFGRKIKLMMCSEIMRKYILDNNLKEDDLVFTFKPDTLNDKLKKIGKKVLGDKYTLGKKKGSELTMYDFRHSSVCYWLPRYKVRSQLLYRFGWKQEKEIFYYSNLLGMTDNISEEDLLLGMDKTAIEKELSELREENKKNNKKIKLLEEMFLSVCKINNLIVETTHKNLATITDKIKSLKAIHKPQLS